MWKGLKGLSCFSDYYMQTIWPALFPPGVILWLPWLHSRIRSHTEQLYNTDLGTALWRVSSGIIVQQCHTWSCISLNTFKLFSICNGNVYLSILNSEDFVKTDHQLYAIAAKAINSCMLLQEHRPIWENLFMPYTNNKGVGQHAHPHNLISAFVVRCLDSIIPLLAIAKISRL